MFSFQGFSFNHRMSSMWIIHPHTVWKMSVLTFVGSTWKQPPDTTWFPTSAMSRNWKKVFEITLKAPQNRPGRYAQPQNERLVFQPSICRAKMWVSGECKFFITFNPQTGFAIVTWNNPKKVGETLHHQVTCYLSIFRVPIFPWNFRCLWWTISNDPLFSLTKQQRFKDPIA